MFCAITHTERFAIIIITYSAVQQGKIDFVIAIIGWFSSPFSLFLSDPPTNSEHLQNLYYYKISCFDIEIELSKCNNVKQDIYSFYPGKGHSNIE